MDDLDDLILHLVSTTRLSRPEAVRVVQEVFAFLAESPEAFVVRRHAELRTANQPNAAIFERIARELRDRRFRGPDLSERQIRRLIYG